MGSRGEDGRLLFKILEEFALNQRMREGGWSRGGGRRGEVRRRREDRRLLF